MGMTYTKLTLGALAVATKKHENEEDVGERAGKTTSSSTTERAGKTTSSSTTAPPRVGVTLLGAASCLPLVFGFYSSIVLVRDYQQRTGDALAGAAIGIVSSLSCW